MKQLGIDAGRALRPVALIAGIALGCGCGASARTAAPAPRAAAGSAGCRRRVAKFRRWMSALIDEGFEARPAGRSPQGRLRLVAVPLKATTAPVSPGAHWLAVTADEVDVDGVFVMSAADLAKVAVHKAPLRAFALRDALARAKPCGSGASGLRSAPPPAALLLDIDRDTPWREITVIEAAARWAGFQDLLFAVRQPSALPAPHQVAGVGPRAAYGSCPQAMRVVAKAAAHPRARPALYRARLPAAIGACRCRVDFAVARAYHWAESGRDAGGMRRAVLPVRLAVPGASWSTVALAGATPWHAAAATLAAAAASGKLSFLLVDKRAPGAGVAATTPRPRRCNGQEVSLLDPRKWGGVAARGLGIGSLGAGQRQSLLHALNGRRLRSTGKPARVRPGIGGLPIGKRAIQKVVRAHLKQAQRCYERALVRNPKLHGKVLAHFTIGAQGKVVSATATGMDAHVSSCIAALLRTFVFPKPHGGGPVKVNYPFVFTTN